jgi:hypothetical protein
LRTQQKHSFFIFFTGNSSLTSRRKLVGYDSFSDIDADSDDDDENEEDSEAGSESKDGKRGLKKEGTENEGKSIKKMHLLAFIETVRLSLLHKKHEKKVVDMKEMNRQIEEQNKQRQDRMYSALLSDSNGSSNQSSRYMQGSSKMKEASRRMKKNSILLSGPQKRGSISMLSSQLMNKQQTSSSGGSRTSFSQAHFLAPKKRQGLPMI